MHLRLSNRMSSTSDRDDDVLRQRRIRFASEIPSLGLNGFERTPRPVRLRGVVDAQSEAFVVANGAVRQGPFWVVARRDPFPFDLGKHLPRMAQRDLVPEVVERGHGGDWRSSLAGILAPSSWDRLVGEIWRAERVCHECGGVPFRPDRLEGHDVWREEVVGRSVVRTLVAVRLLCPECRWMGRLDEASAVGRGERAFDRLCAANRISPAESAAYLGRIDERAALRIWDRERVEIDLSALPGRILVLKGSIVPSGETLVHSGDGFGEIVVRGAEVVAGRQTVLRT